LSNSWTIVELHVVGSSIVPLLLVSGYFHLNVSSSVCLWSNTNLFTLRLSLHQDRLGESTTRRVREAAPERKISLCAIFVLKLVKLHSRKSKRRVACVRQVSWRSFLNKELLIVLKGVFLISEVQSPIVNELLVVARHRDYDLTWYSSSRRINNHRFISNGTRLQSVLTKSDFQITETSVGEAFASDSNSCGS
jgi:hypothetical protein